MCGPILFFVDSAWKLQQATAVSSGFLQTGLCMLPTCQMCLEGKGVDNSVPHVLHACIHVEDRRGDFSMSRPIILGYSSPMVHRTIEVETGASIELLLHLAKRSPR